MLEIVHDMDPALEVLKGAGWRYVDPETAIRKLQQKTTRGGQRVNDYMASSFYHTKNPAPQWCILQALTPCRLRDSANPSVLFFTNSATGFDTAFLHKRECETIIGHIYTGDILLWFYKRGGNGEPGPVTMYPYGEKLALQIATSQRTRDSQPLMVNASATVVFSSFGFDSGEHARRTGFVVLRDLST
jgi:hypothetical protein